MLEQLIFGIIVAGLTILLLLFLKKRTKSVKFLNNNKTIIWGLILWTIIGFLSQLDFSERCGCLIHNRNIFSLDYIIYSTASLFLFILAIIIKHKKAVKTIIYVELLYWLFKLFILKSGYVLGLGLPLFNIYDYIGLFLRLWLVFILIKNRYKIYIFPIITTIVILLKLELNPCGKNILYDNYINPILERNILEKLNGEWKGDAKHNFLLYKNIKPDTIYFENILNLKTVNKKTFDTTQLFYNLNDTNFGHINNQNDTIIEEFVYNISFIFKDTVVIISGFNKEYNKKYTLNRMHEQMLFLQYYPEELLNTESYSENHYSDSIRKHEIEISIIELENNNCQIILNSEYLVSLKRK